MVTASYSRERCGGPEPGWSVRRRQAGQSGLWPNAAPGELGCAVGVQLDFICVQDKAEKLAMA